MENPCYNTSTGEDCPRRKPGCGAHCKEWAKYVRKRDEIYNTRKDRVAMDSYEVDRVYKHRRHLRKRK